MGFLAPASRNRVRLRFAPYDVACALFAPVIALTLRDPNLLSLEKWADGPPPAALFTAVATLAALVAFLLFRLSDGMSRFFSVHDFVAVCGAVATTIGATSLFMFTFTRLDGIPRSTPFIFALVLAGALILGRAFHRVVAAEQGKALASWKPDQLRNIVIVGADPFSSIAIRLIDSQIPTTTRVLALLDENPDLIGRTISGVRVAAGACDLDSVLEEYEVHGVAVDQVLISDQSNLSAAACEALEAICEKHEIELLSISEAFGLIPKTVGAVADVPAAARLVRVSTYFGVKRVFDIFASFIALILLAPLIVVVAGLVLIDVGSPVLFWQERIGRNGRRFLLHKFRTYKAPYDWRGDPVPPEERLSRIGKLLRATRFDEIPQLFSILVGDMSLIGPRPLLPKDQPADPSIRLLARPGISGWAQINGGNLVTPEEKEALDAWYIEHASPLVDLKILIHSAIIAAKGERLNRRAVADALRWRGSVNDRDEPESMPISANIE